MKIGIVGLPNVGKSTLFRALTKKQIDIANYPFTTIEPSVGIAEVPDDRLVTLGSLSHSAKIIPAIIEFVDIAGLVKGAAEGEGLGNQFLSHIKEVDTIAEVVRVFENKNIIHVHNRVDPANDIEIIHLELIFKDLETVKKRRQNIEKEVRSQKKDAVAEHAMLEKIKLLLKQGIMPNTKTFSEEEQAAINQLGLLTAKPILFVLNGSETMLQNKWKPDEALIKTMAGRPYVILSANLEDEINALTKAEQKEFLSSLGLTQSGLTGLIQKGYEILNLITFFTTGEKESRAWTIPAGSCAPRAGRAIHSDFEEKFIRAEVISYEKFVEAGSYARARELGWLRTEGKEYVMQDGDIVEFKI